MNNKQSAISHLLSAISYLLPPIRDKRYAMRNTQYAVLIACAAPIFALALVIASASAMAAPPPPPSNIQPPKEGDYPISNIQPTGGSALCFFRAHALTCVSRVSVQATGSPGDQARALMQALLAGPTSAERASGLRSAFPEGAQLADVTVTDDAVTVELLLPESFLYGGLDPLVSDEIVEQVVKTLYPLDLRKFTVLAQDPRDPAGAFKPISYFLFEPPPTHKSEQAREAAIGIAAYNAAGALAGKAVYLSAGHGWYWDAFWGEWRTQRYAADSFQLIEDMNNAEVVNQYLIQYLRNAGADVWPVREHDMNTQEMIVVHSQPAYSEIGDWTTSTQTGYQGLAYRQADVTSTATATATWMFTPTTSARYAVYVWYNILDSSLHAPDAQYFVVHDGGATEVHVDQRVHGIAWRYIGTFPFAANVPGQVILTNKSSTTSAIVIADAVRVGGGMGTEYGSGPPVSPSPSGKPRWEEAARYWAKYQGAPPNVYAPSPCTSYGASRTDLCQDITARPNYAEWEHPSGEDAVYLSWHSNGYNGSIRGTESYIYNGDFVTGSDRLQDWVHTALIHDIRAGWDPDWTDRGQKQRDLGEVRRLETMPGALFEIAFHDQADDTAALKDARFAQLTARAMYKGIVRYFAEKDATALAISPEPPQNLVVRNSGPGQVVVSWRPSLTDTAGLLGDAATGYRVYTSDDGLGWNDGTPVTGTSFTLPGLVPGQLIFVRVTATNAGGESFPTPIAAARVASSGTAPMLIVNGYERIDRLMDVMRCDTPEENCPNARIWPAQMNDQSYIIQHATAIPLPFDSAERAAVDSGDIALGAYDIVDWIAGQEQAPMSPKGTEAALTQAEQVTLTAFLTSGHALFLSGSEVAFDLATNSLFSKTQTLFFMTNTLRIQYAGDNAKTFAVTPTASGILSGLAPFQFDDGAHGSYAVNYPDFVTPTNGSLATLNYAGGAGGTAAVEYAEGCQRLVYMGFPFETIYPVAMRQAVMARVMSFLGGSCVSMSSTVVILSPAHGGFYNYAPPINGIAGDPAQVDHVDIAVAQITTPQIFSGSTFILLPPEMRFLSGTSWVTTETWLSATGGATWSFTPAVALADAPYAIWARAWNRAGFSTPRAVVSFTMDTIPPTAPVPITPTGGITLPSANVALVFSPGFDLNGVAGYAVLVDGNLYTTTATSFPLANLSAGPHTWAVRAFDAAGNVSSWATATFAVRPLVTYLPIILRDYSASVPPAGPCQELVRNGGFETPGEWYSLSSVKPITVSSPVHAGLASLLIGYTTTANAQAIYSSIQQTITIPLTATKTTLTFWRYPVSGDTQGDFQYLAIGRTPTSVSTVWTNKSNEQAWTQTAFDLSTYTGTLTIRLGVYNDGQNGVTAMYLDDVLALSTAVQSCSP